MTMLFDRSILRAPDAPSAPSFMPDTVSPGKSWSPLLTRLFVAVGIGLFLCLPTQADAQQPAPPPPDTVEVVEQVRSPRGAFVRSLVVPGWGQAWVGAPVRGGVYFALEVGALWMTYKSHQQLREARRQEQWRRDTGQLQPAQLDPLSRSREDQVEDWFTVALFLLFFSGADAFVSAHLADFGERVGVAPAPGGGVQVRAVLPLGGRP
jgi:hypothetical protein